MLEKEIGSRDKEEEQANEENEGNCKICPMCDHKIPLERKNARDSLRRCYDCGAITHKDERTSKSTFCPPSDEEEDD